MFVTKIKIHIQLWQVFCYHHTILTYIVAKKISVVIPPMEFNEPAHVMPFWMSKTYG
jgi:hypothetical protein